MKDVHKKSKINHCPLRGGFLGLKFVQSWSKFEVAKRPLPVILFKSVAMGYARGTGGVGVGGIVPPFSSKVYLQQIFANLFFAIFFGKGCKSWLGKAVFGGGSGLFSDRDETRADEMVECYKHSVYFNTNISCLFV